MYRTPPLPQSKDGEPAGTDAQTKKEFHCQPFHFMYAGCVGGLVSLGTDGGRISRSHTHTQLVQRLWYNCINSK